MKTELYAEGLTQQQAPIRNVICTKDSKRLSWNMIFKTYHVLTGLEVKRIRNAISKGSKSICL